LLIQTKKGGDFKRIREYERQSLKPYGKFVRSGFKFDKEKLPFYDIPDLSGFELRPYVEYNALKLSDSLKNHQTQVNKDKIEKLT